MKLSIKDPVNGGDTGNYVDLAWNPASGTYQGLFHRMADGGTPADATAEPYSSSAQTPLTVSSNVEVTSAGTRRVLVKVDMPYLSYQKDGTDVTINEDRTSGNVSLHMVLTVPARMAEDLQGNSVQASNARSQILLLLWALGCLTRTSETVATGSDNGIRYPWEMALDSGTGDPTLLKAIVTASGEGGGAVWTVGAAQYFGSDHPLLRGAVGMKPLVDREY